MLRSVFQNFINTKVIMVYSVHLGRISGNWTIRFRTVYYNNLHQIFGNRKVLFRSNPTLKNELHLYNPLPIFLQNKL